MASNWHKQKHFKRATNCPGCGINFWEKSWEYRDGQSVTVWECPNCGHKDARKVQAKREATEATPSQLQTVELLKTRLVKDTERYEFKRFEQELRHGDLWLRIEVGMKGDEGTMASIVCRDHYHMYIGRNGGLHAFDRNSKLVTGRAAFWTRSL